MIAAMKQKIEESNRQLWLEFESERAHHQKLVKDYARLQQRHENLQTDLHLNVVGHGGGLHQHSRSPSNLSNLSAESETSSCEKNDLVGFTRTTDVIQSSTDCQTKAKELMASLIPNCNLEYVNNFYLQDLGYGTGKRKEKDREITDHGDFERQRQESMIELQKLQKVRFIIFHFI